MSKEGLYEQANRGQFCYDQAFIGRQLRYTSFLAVYRSKFHNTLNRKYWYSINVLFYNLYLLLLSYYLKGYVIVENFFGPEVIEPCLEACGKLVDDMAQKLFKAGKIKGVFDVGV